MRLTALNKHLFAQFHLSQNLIIKKSFHLGNCLKSKITQPLNKLSKAITHEFGLPIDKGGKMSGNYSCRIATVDDKEAVLEVLRRSYYPEEPLTSGQHEKSQDHADEEYTVSLLQHGTSVVAFDLDKNNKMIGVIIADIFSPSSSERKLQEAERIEDTNKQWSNVLRLLAHLEDKANIFERYNVQKALDLFAMTVDKEYRGKDVSGKMVQMVEDNAKRLGYPLAVTLCTSYFTIQLCKRLKLECVQEFKYAEYKDSNGKQVFDPPPPHTHFAMYAKVLK